LLFFREGVEKPYGRSGLENQYTKTMRRAS